MTGEVFWTKVSNAVRFLDDAMDCLICGQSVILNFDETVPWLEVLKGVIGERLMPVQGTYTLDYHNGSDVEEPGEYLFSRYFSERERKKYWPAMGSLEMFMAQHLNTPLHRRFILVSDIPGQYGHRWAASVSDYLDNCTDPDEHAVFLLIVSGGAGSGAEHITVLDYRDYISDYDCLMLCMNLLTDLNSPTLVKKYISELAVQLSGNRLEYAGRLTERGLNLIRYPRAMVQEVFPELTPDEATELTEQCLWEVQLRIVFPVLERSRREFVRKYHDKLKEHLPITDSAGDRITEPGAIEIGQLHHLCSLYHLADRVDFDRLCYMRTARNNLAHGGTISYEDLLKLGIC